MSRVTRQLAVPAVLGLVIGVVLAFQSGTSNAAKLGAFVQATILDPATGALSVYEPLVVTQGTRPDTPGMKLIPPVIPADAVVTIDFGFNGTDLVQVGATPTTLADAHCGSGQCNGAGFFAAVRLAERKGLLKVPSPGTSSTIAASGGDLGTGRSCPVISNFEVAGLDPGESVTTTYLLNPLTGQTAQDNTTYQDYIPGSTLLHGSSANALLDQYVDPILGCTPFQAPDLSNASVPASSETLDEIAADAYPPKNTAQAPAQANDNDTATYCQNLIDIQTPFLSANQTLLATGQSPVTATADNLLTFLANRLSASFTSLGCQRFHLTNPVTLKRDGAGVAIAATFDTAVQTAQ